MNVVMQRKETVICLKLGGSQNLCRICANYRNEQNEFADFIQARMSQGDTPFELYMDIGDSMYYICFSKIQ